MQGENIQNIQKVEKSAPISSISPNVSSELSSELSTELSARALEDEIAILFANIQVATHRLLLLIAELDRRSDWGNGNFRSTAHWLNWRLGLDLGAAREKVRVARALESLPKISQALTEGRLSYSKVRALTRIAVPQNEESLLCIALHTTASHVEQLVRRYRRTEKLGLEEGEAQHEARGVRTFMDTNGMWVIEGRLPPELGAIVQAALDAARERLPNEESKNVDISTLQADALVQVAEASMREEKSGSRKPLLTVHVDAQVLADAEAPGRAEVQEHGRVSGETARRLGCDASVVAMLHKDGEVLDVGRQRRTIPTTMRRALYERDKGCRFPGCNVSARFTDAHHLVHWADGGETKLSNLLLLCRVHHRKLHEGGYRIARAARGDFVFHAPDGQTLPQAPSLPRPCDNAEVFFREQQRRRMGLVTDADTLTAWNGEAFDYGYLLDLVWVEPGEHPQAESRREHSL